MSQKPKVAFICVHNSCRSQIAEALGTLLASDVFEGCNVNCPNLPCKHREDWGLDDPTGKSEVEYLNTISAIEEKVLTLKSRVEQSGVWSPATS